VCELRKLEQKITNLGINKSNSRRSRIPTNNLLFAS